MFTDVSYNYNDKKKKKKKNINTTTNNNNLKKEYWHVGYIGGEDGGVNVCVGVLYACVRSRVCVEGRIILKDMYACF